MLIAAGTGHRPHILPCKYDENHAWLRELKKRIKETLTKNHVDEVIAGGAIGFDTWLAQSTLELKIPLHVYVPFKGQEAKWPARARKEYERILSLAKTVNYIDEEYTPSSFHKRDRAMVDDCNLVLALWNPTVSEGGTFYTVNYAKDKGKRLINLWKE